MRKIYLTAGHQVIEGKGTGAHGFGDEAVEALKLRDEITLTLRRMGLTVINDPPADPLMKVINWLIASVTPNDVIVDLHFNSFIKPEAEGSEVVIPEKYSQRELAIATDLIKATTGALGTKLRRGKMIVAGVKTESETAHKSIGILNKPHKADNVLVEVCFISNYDDMDKYHRFRPALSSAYADVIYKHAMK